LQKYLIEHRIDAKDKDSIYNLVKGLLVLDDEFGGLATKDVKDFKKIADANQIDIRLPYSAFYSKMKRKASLCGTSNEVDILKDVTGNRRILPINVQSIDYNQMVKINTDDLWREVFDLYRKDYDWKIYSSQDIDFLNSNTSSNLEVMPVEELFFSRFSKNYTQDFTERKIYNQGDVLNLMNINTSINVSKYDIKDIFTKNKMSYQTYRYGNSFKKGYELFVKSEVEKTEEDEIPF
jgi:predicted P-loop ATPase